MIQGNKPIKHFVHTFYTLPKVITPPPPSSPFLYFHRIIKLNVPQIEICVLKIGVKPTLHDELLIMDTEY